MAAKERNGSMRDTMPTVAGWIDELREAFGKAEIDAVIREGLKADCAPEKRFFAQEGEHKVGQQYQPRSVVSGAQMVVGPWASERKGK